MGSYFRRSVNFGPIRLNFSRAGIGISAGVKGARISSGPRGTYVHVGRNNFYYRQRVGQPSHNEQRREPVLINPITSSRSFVIESADVSQLTETSIAELLNQINGRLAQTRLAPFAIAATALCVIVTWLVVSAIAESVSEVGASQSTMDLAILAAFGASLVIGVTGSVLSWRIHQADELDRTTPLFYELEPNAEENFRKTQSACEVLSHAARSWRVYTNQPTWDWKRNAGASDLITRQQISVGKQSPPYIATNVEVWFIALSDLTLFFLPDYVFVRQRGKYGAVSYESLRISFAPSRFIEDQGVPPDAQIVDYTWRFVNKRGGPDRRFSNNYQLPIVQYGFLHLKSPTGLNIHLNVSNLHVAATFANAFIGNGNPTRASQKETSQARPSPGSERPYIDPKIKFAYETLGVSVYASQEEIISAYRAMAKMYHPDKLVHLAPEFIQLAEERMKEINAAYETLKRR